MLAAEVEVKLRRFCSFMVRPSVPPSHPGQRRIIRAFPWREEIEFAEFLIEPDGFVHHPLLLGRRNATSTKPVSGKSLPQRMAVEAVIGQQPPHVRMAMKITP